MMTLETNDLAQRSVGSLVAEDYRRAAVFKRFGIDFCCGGGASLQSVCDKKGVSLADVAAALDAAEARGHAPQARVTSWAPGFLADYVVNEHHGYVRESVPVLRAFTQKIARVHGAAHPELSEIARLFDTLGTELEAHMNREEQAVFPAIKAAEQDAEARQALRGFVGEMEGEHDEAGELMRRIRELSGDYTPPHDACSTYRAAFVKLEEFEDDLHRHVHLENNVLFPKALALVDEASGDGAPEAATCEVAAPRPADRVLDVRVIPPPQKHPAIFSTFDALASGEAFVLVNDHDPVPLKHQFSFTRPGQVAWTYLEQGPEVWRVRIARV